MLRPSKFCLPSYSPNSVCNIRIFSVDFMLSSHG
jgi:hypothetical protein